MEPPGPPRLPRPPPSPRQRNKISPPPPTLSSTRTHIDALTAQRDDLSLQHANLQKLINSVLKVDLASPLVVDEKMRRAAKKRLEGLKERLGEVEREEHEVGRALARARRRVEREEGAESGLWVRRATG
ncbi:hypothetical protein H2203_007364 [Taxawa tesnikishii (nom. ined.)]|nr:hypothetical protein H2203_007364 [Dothideales sp. JES 119]